jgi:CRISPR/Cas system-associated endonuclease Cas3-HD
MRMDRSKTSREANYVDANIVRVIVSIAVLATAAILGTAVAQKSAVPKPQDKLALGQNEVRQLLLLMDADQSGKISKQEWMKFMEAEFDRLDKDKKGQLDVKELRQSKLRVSHPVSVGK